MQMLARDIVVDPLDIGTYLTQAAHFNAHVGAYDRVLIGYGAKTTPEIDLAKARRVDTLPELGFTAYHPDLAYILEGETVVNGAVGAYHSIIAFVAHGLGRSVDETLLLFNGRVYGTCGYYDCWTAARDELVGYCDYLGFDVSQAVQKWARNGPFMFSTNHPRIQVLYDIARIYLEREGYETHVSDILPHDNLVNSGVFPVYPEIGDFLGVAGNYLFKRVNEYTQIGLRQFVEESFAVYDGYEPGALAVNERSLPTRAGQVGVERNRDGDMTNPYADLPDHQFWRRSISRVETHRVDPVVAPRFRLAPTDRIATAGSCFAQHIARKLVEVGHGFHVTEPGEHLAVDERLRHGYGVYSARFGNVYTTAQLRQLFDEALGLRAPAENDLQRPDGRLVDPWRQQVEPDGFATLDELLEDRKLHLAAVRRMMSEADVFIYTLGLTEAWRSKADGSVYSAAPGVVAGSFDPARHEFVNFDVDAVRADLFAALETLREVNPKVRVILTVSPVPLVATYEPRSVLVSTTYSKAVLRVVADSAIRRFDWVDYFPSYEIITGSFAGGLYYEDDYREVNRLGVAHAMRCFIANFIDEPVAKQVEPAPFRPPVPTDLVCDEEVLDGVRF